jgi:GTPase
VIAVNKWDIEEDKAGKAEGASAAVRTGAAATQGRAADHRLGEDWARAGPAARCAIVAAHTIWNRRIGTARLNQWLAAMTEAHPPPAPAGRRVRLRYITQARTRPPGFVIMCSNPEALPKSYERYLINGLRESFEMPGTPIRLFLRSQSEANPYKDRKKTQPSRLKKHLRPGRG